MALLPLRYPASGPPYDARDGVIVVFFIRKSHATLAPTIGTLFEAYVALVGEDALQFIVASEEWKPLTPQRRARARKRMSSAAAKGLPNEALEMKGGCSGDDVGAYAFFYYGTDLTDEAADRALLTLHSTARQAAELAAGADVGLLALTHVSTRYVYERDGSHPILDEAQAVFPRTVLPRDFDEIEVPLPERGAPSLVRSADRRPAPAPAT